MAVPNRPAAGGVVESAWGQVVHDTAVVQDIQTGQLTCTHAGNKVSAVVAVTFPRPFASPPRVAFACGNFNYSPGSDGSVPTATGFKVATYRIDQSAANAPVPVDWIAIGPRA